jgi:hypothetical protein
MTAAAFAENYLLNSVRLGPHVAKGDHVALPGFLSVALLAGFAVREAFVRLDVEVLRRPFVSATCGDDARRAPSASLLCTSRR